VKIIIIGSGADVLKYGDGERIDKFDIVVRINKFKILPPFTKFTGTKTDYIFCRKKHLTEYFESEDVQKNIIFNDYRKFLKMFNFTNSEKIKQIFYNNFFYEKNNFKFNKKIICIDEGDCNYLNKDLIYLKLDKLLFSKKIKKIPFTTGYLAILFFKKYFKNHEIYILGFDSFLNSYYYWSDKNEDILKYIKLMNIDMYNKNPYFKENLIIKQMIKNNEIKLF